MGGDTANDDLEACKHRKKRRRQQILYNLFDFLAIAASMLSLFTIQKKDFILFI
jgi:hypothetical protein